LATNHRPVTGAFLFGVQMFELKHTAEDGTTITMTFEANYLPDVLMNIKHFLQGVGFSIRGELEVVEDEV